MVRIALVVWLAAVLAACGKAPAAARTVTWALDVEATVGRAEPEQQAAVRKKLAGVDVVLELRGDNTYRLTITGGKDALLSEGTYKSGFDAIFLRAASKDGTPIPEAQRDDWRLRSQGAKTIEVESGSLFAVLTRR